LAECYHRSLTGKVVWLEMTRPEVEAAIALAPWAWSTELHGFKPWPPELVRGNPVAVASLADMDMPK
jgi:hypothetical protein